MEYGLVVHVLGWHHGLDDILHEVSVDLVIGDVRRMLSGNENGVHANGNHGTALLLVLNCHLGLAVRPQPCHAAIFPHLHPQRQLRPLFNASFHVDETQRSYTSKVLQGAPQDMQLSASSKVNQTDKQMMSSAI